MALSITCPQCGATNEYSESDRGRDVVCVECARVVPVPPTRPRARPASPPGGHPRARPINPPVVPPRPPVAPTPPPPAPEADEIPLAELEETPEEIPLAELEETPEEIPEADLDEPVEISAADLVEPDEEHVPDIHLEIVHAADPRAESGSPRPPDEPEPAQPPGLPFKLERNERILLRAGFGTIGGWVWICTVFPMSLGCFSVVTILQALAALLKGQYLVMAFWLVFTPVILAIGFWPLLRTGRYWLTTHRLVWKPRLGGLQKMWIEDIRTDQISGDKLKSKLVVWSHDRKIVLRYVSGLDRLWGGILVLSTMDPDALVPSGKGVADVSWWRGGRSQGLRSQFGLLVLRPEYVAFLPTRKSVHLGLELFKHTVGKAVMDVLGMEDRFPVEARVPFDVLVGVMSEQAPEQFDEFIRGAVDQFGGLLWERDRVEVFRESSALIPGLSSVAFRHRGVKIQGKAARDQCDTIDRILSSWTAGAPLPMRYPVAPTALVGAIGAGIMAVLIYQGQTYDEPIVEVGAVTPVQVMDRTAAPEKSFVTVTGHLDPDHVTHLKPERKKQAGHVLIVFRESPQLILHVSEDHELSKAIKKRETATGKKAVAAAAEDLEQSWTVSGQLYTGGADGWPHTKIPVPAVRDYARNELGAGDVTTTRVLMVGMTPEGQLWSARVPYGLACFFGLLAALAWLGAFRMIVLRLTSGSAGSS